jgi:glycosyltransferase involved in cell wall biosynthesis
MYDAIRQGTLLISRFSSAILESLALGKPVIYHNPHREKAEKFQDSMGAYPVTASTAQLADAIRATLADVESGMDVRSRAREYLHEHTNMFAEPGPAAQSAEVIVDLLRGNASGEGPRGKPAVDRHGSRRPISRQTA